MSALSAPYMRDEAAAFAHVEAMLWPDGPVCPACGAVDDAYVLKGVRTKPSGKHPAGKLRHGLRKCRACGRQFTVRIGTIFEDSHIDLHLWLRAIHLTTGGEERLSSNRLSRALGVTVRSAWSLSHRIRAAMRDGGAADFGSGGGAAALDETVKRIAPRKGGKPARRA